MVALSQLYLVKQHLTSFFDGHEFEELEWPRGPMAEAAPWFRVLRFPPGPRLDLWTYVSLGASTLREDDADIEFTIFSDYESPRFVELLTMAAYFHRDFKLGLEHTATLGEPWVEGSKCNSYLVSLPYPLGPDFPTCTTRKGQVNIFWLLPITAQERAYKIKKGVEALEEVFDSAELAYWDFGRKSVI